MTDTKRLREFIAKSGLKYVYIAERLGLSRQGLRLKINNNLEFRVSEVEALSNLLKLSKKDRDDIFFNH